MSFEIFSSGWGWTGELWLNLIVLIFGNKEIFFSDNKKFFQNLRFFFWKKVIFCDLRFSEFFFYHN